MDPYYPTEAHGSIPAFQNFEEEAEFWDTHSILDLPGDYEMHVSWAPDRPPTGIIVFELDFANLTKLRMQASKAGTEPSDLVAAWIKERLAG